MMAIAGAGLVAASPAGPVQAVPDPVGVGGWGCRTMTKRWIS